MNIPDVLPYVPGGLSEAEQRKMADIYRTVYRMGNGYYEEKKSRFFCEVHHVESEEEALAVLSAVFCCDGKGSPE